MIIRAASYPAHQGLNYLLRIYSYGPAHQGLNYLLRMLNDLEELESFPIVGAELGVTTIGNPLLLPPIQVVPRQ